MSFAFYRPASCLFIRRINALYYDKSRLVVAFMACILLAETVINVYLLVYAIRTLILLIPIEELLMALPLSCGTLEHTEPGAL